MEFAVQGAENGGEVEDDGDNGHEGGHLIPVHVAGHRSAN